MPSLMRRAITLFLLAIAATPLSAQQEPAVDTPAPDSPVTVTALSLPQADEIVDVLSTTYAANLALETAIRTSACTKTDPRCAPLFLAEEAVLGPWNFVKLLRVVQEASDPNFSTVFQLRDYRSPLIPVGAALPESVASLGAYTLEQQTTLYRHLEGWEVTLDRYNAAMRAHDASASAAQRRALDEYSRKASLAASASSAASQQLLESLTPLLTPFAELISAEEAAATKLRIQESGFTPELKERFASFGIAKAESDLLADELFALSDDVTIDLVDGLGTVARSFDKLADLLLISPDGTAVTRPVANAGPDQRVPAGSGDSATVTLNATGSHDPAGGALQYAWIGASVTAAGPTPTVQLPRGTHYIVLTVTDANGAADVDLVTIHVTDDAARVVLSLRH